MGPRASVFPGNPGRRGEILAGALAAFDALGYDQATIADIRSRSGASTGSIYHHFESKAGLAAALHDAIVAHYHQLLLEQIRPVAAAKDRVRALVFHHMDWAVTYPAQARFLLRLPADQGMLGLPTAGRDFQREVHSLLAPSIARGEIVELPAALYPLLIVAPAQEMVRQWLAGRLSLDPRAVAGALADLAWKALATVSG